MIGQLVNDLDLISGQGFVKPDSDYISLRTRALESHVKVQFRHEDLLKTNFKDGTLILFSSVMYEDDVTSDTLGMCVAA